MKEFTIEEKARRYDEAYKKVAVRFGSNVADEIFPELKESEDERIRKELIQNLKERFGTHGSMGVMLDMPRVIAWLEKQGNKVIDCSQNHKDMNNPNGCIVLEDFNGGDGFYKVHLDYLNKKQVEEVEEMVRAWNKESKTSDDNIKSCIGICLTDADEQRFKDFGTNLKECLDWLEKQGNIDKASYDIAEKEKRELVEQKPAWSEEDERKLELLRALIEDTKGDSASYSTMFIEMEEIDNWLNSIKDRVQPQPKQEWSEEDEEMFNRCIKTMKGAYYQDGKALRWLENRFKSLILQNKWKPSDEQIITLEYYMHTLICNKHKEILFGLYTDLKKLKG